MASGFRVVDGRGDEGASDRDSLCWPLRHLRKGSAPNPGHPRLQGWLTVSELRIIILNSGPGRPVIDGSRPSVDRCPLVKTSVSSSSAGSRSSRPQGRERGAGWPLRVRREIARAADDISRTLETTARPANKCQRGRRPGGEVDESERPGGPVDTR
jgi:hypothetical protein